MTETSSTVSRIGIYPGTFDPVTQGHMDIIRRATRIVEQALEFEMQVPQALLNRLKVQTGFDPNPTVHVENDGKAPF